MACHPRTPSLLLPSIILSPTTRFLTHAVVHDGELHQATPGAACLRLRVPPRHLQKRCTPLVVGAKSTSTYEFPEGGFIITMEGTVVEVDMFCQRVVSLLKYEKWQSGRLVAAELQRFAMRWYGVEEFTGVLGCRSMRVMMPSKRNAWPA